MKAHLKWQRATIIQPTDHIVSSKAREMGILGFKPQYETAKHVNFRFLLSNEYKRLWFKEREVYQKENYAKQEKARTDSKLKRGFVQRMMIMPKQRARELPIITLKRFQNAKTELRKVPEKPLDRFHAPPKHLIKYKPACPPQKLSTRTEDQKQNETNTQQPTTNTQQQTSKATDAQQQTPKAANAQQQTSKATNAQQQTSKATNAQEQTPKATNSQQQTPKVTNSQQQTPKVTNKEPLELEEDAANCAFVCKLV